MVHSNSDEPNLNHHHWRGTRSPRGDGGRTPLPPRGLRFRGTSSLDLFYAERLRTEAGRTLEGGRALVPPPQSRVPDEDIAARPQDLQPWRPGDFPRSTLH